MSTHRYRIDSPDTGRLVLVRGSEGANSDEAQGKAFNPSLTKKIEFEFCGFAIAGIGFDLGL